MDLSDLLVMFYIGGLIFFIILLLVLPIIIALILGIVIANFFTMSGLAWWSVVIFTTVLLYGVIVALYKN